MNNNKAIRQLVLNLLDDEHGICPAAYQSLQEFAGGVCEDIFAKVDYAKTRYFLNEDHGLKA